MAIVSAGGDGLIKLWNADTRRWITNLTGHKGSVMALVADASTRALYSGATDGTIRTWDLSLNLCKRTLPVL